MELGGGGADCGLMAKGADHYRYFLSGQEGGGRGNWGGGVGGTDCGFIGQGGGPLSIFLSGQEGSGGGAEGTLR